MRLFVALSLPEPVLERLEDLLSELGRAVPDVRWARPGSLHVTLKFLGEVEEPRIPSLCAALSAAAGRAGTRFSMEVEGLGTFGDRRHPRVVWVGIHERTGALAALQEVVEGVCVGEGFEKEGRPFRPHLTLARLKGRFPGLGRALATRAGVKLGAFRVSSFSLIQSLLRPEGARYVPLERFVLEGRAEPG
jgi:2'-5' RNA ligase